LHRESTAPKRGGDVTHGFEEERVSSRGVVHMAVLDREQDEYRQSELA
jgi:hypothetical protein